LGNISSVEILDLGHTIVKIESENDTISGNQHFILFTSYDLSTPENIKKFWYANTDSGLYVIAYTGAGSSQPVLPKGMSSDHQIIASLTISKSMQLFIPVFFNNNQSDSVLYYIPPRKVLHYPLKTGTRWVELENPFFRERFVNDKKEIEVPAGIYSCYKVEADWNFDLEFTDYISTKDGLVKRYFSADSVVYVNVEPGDTIGHVKLSTISELVGKNF